LSLTLVHKDSFPAPDLRGFLPPKWGLCGGQ
jgi:hypothetical protein